MSNTSTTTETSILNRLKERATFANRLTDKGIINENTGTSLRMNEAGNVTVASSKNVQYKMHYAKGQATELSYESNTITNRKNILTDEIIINKHKINPQLWNWTDMKKFQGDPTMAIGNLTMGGTVLVKAWEPTLQKWVLIRRPIRTPIFSNLLPLVGAHEGMGLDDNISEEIIKGRS